MAAFSFGFPAGVQVGLPRMSWFLESRPWRQVGPPVGRVGDVAGTRDSEAIVADVFMSSIETITSKKRRGEKPKPLFPARVRAGGRG